MCQLPSKVTLLNTVGQTVVPDGQSVLKTDHFVDSFTIDIRSMHGVSAERLKETIEKFWECLGEPNHTERTIFVTEIKAK